MKKLFVFALIAFMPGICLNGLKQDAFAQSDAADSLKEEAQYIALIVDLKGKASIKRWKMSDDKPAQWGAYLYQGDTIKVGDSSSVSLLYSGGLMLTLTENSQMTMNVHPGASNDPMTTDMNEKYKVVPQFKKLKIFEAVKPRAITYSDSDGILRLGSGPRDRLTPVRIITPFNTAITKQRPAFQWNSLYKDAEYVVTLMSPDCTTIWEERTSNLQLKSPQKLEKGKEYLWSVSVYRDFEQLSFPVYSQIKILTPTELKNYQKILNKLKKSIDKQQTTTFYNFLFGNFYLKYDLLEQAIPHFQNITELNPNSLLAHEALCRLYWDQGFVEKADAEFQLWKKLLAQK